MGGDLKAGAKDTEEKFEEAKLQEAQRETMREPKTMETEKEKQATSTPSSNSISEDDNIRKLDSKIVKIRDAPEGDAAFDHLPENERAILKRQLDVPDVKVSYRTLFRYASSRDMLIFYVSCVASIAAGAALPLMTVGDDLFLRGFLVAAY